MPVRAIVRLLVLIAAIAVRASAHMSSVAAQTPTDTAETPTDTAETPTDTAATPEDESQDTTASTSDDTQTRGQAEDDPLPSTGAPVWLFGASGLAILLSGSILLGVDRRIQANLPTAYWEDHTGNGPAR